MFREAPIAEGAIFPSVEFADFFDELHKVPRQSHRATQHAGFLCFGLIKPRVWIIAERVHVAEMSPFALAAPTLTGPYRQLSTSRSAKRRFFGAHRNVPRRSRAVAPDVNIGGEDSSNAVDPASAADGDGFVLDSSGFAVSLGEDGYADADAAKLATRDVVSSRYPFVGADAGAGAPSSSSGASFEPRFDPGPAVATLSIFIAAAVVNRRVANAVDRRRDRERAEEDLRQMRLKSLDGSADFDEVQEAFDRLERAKYEEAAAREMLSSLGIDARVRMPQPLGKPISQVEREEADVAERIAKIRGERRERDSSADASGKRADDEDDADGGIWDKPLPKKTASSSSNESSAAGGPPTWMNVTVGVVLTMLTWSFVGVTFSEDPALGPAIPPEELQRQMEMR